MSVKKLFNRKPKDEEDGIIVLSEPGPLECGGTTATRDTRAPRTITSEDMIFFSVNSAFGPFGAFDRDEDGCLPLRHFSAYAAPAGQGTFLFLSAVRGKEEEKAWTLVKDSPFPALTRLVREHDLARDNGFHSRTHGLPENFGGDVDIRYASGERISFSDNQTPILSPKAGQEIVTLFRTATRGEKLPLPDLADLASIRFEEQRKDGGFTTATLTLLPDGSGSNEKQSRYEDPKIYESTKPVDKETVAGIKKTIEEAGLLAWADLPDNEFFTGPARSLTFTFSRGDPVTVPDGKRLPDPLSRAFFTIQLELETKN